MANGFEELIKEADKPKVKPKPKKKSIFKKIRLSQFKIPTKQRIVERQVLKKFEKKQERLQKKAKQIRASKIRKFKQRVKGARRVIGKLQRPKRVKGRLTL